MTEMKLHHDVVLTQDLPDHGLCAGDVGTAVGRHAAADGRLGWTVEFFDMTGETIAVVTIPQSKLRAPTASDCPSVRPRQSA